MRILIIVNDILPDLIFIVCGLLILLLWYRMNKITRSKGESVNFYFIYPGQFIKFWKIINNEQDKKIKIKYLLIFWIQIAIIPAWFIIWNFIYR